MAGQINIGRGLVALVEYAEPPEQCLTGLVADGEAERIVIDLGASGPLRAEQEEVVVSLFAPEALYRLRATASRTAPEGTVVLDPVHDVERIQRRKAMRTAIRLGVTFSFLDGPDAEIASVVGRTIDVGLGGLRAETMRPFPAGDPTVMMTLPSGESIVATAQVLSVESDPDGYEYRLCFGELDAHDAAALDDLIASSRSSRRARQGAPPA